MDNEFNNNEYNNDQNNEKRDEYVYETYQYGTNESQREEHTGKETEKPVWEDVVTPQKKEKKHSSMKWLVGIVMAIVLGVVASLAFFISAKVLSYVDKKPEIHSSNSGVLESTETVTKPSTVIASDIADVAENVMPSIVSITSTIL